MYSPDRHGLPGAELLRLARGSIQYGLLHDEPLPINCDSLPRALTEPGATFTTLRIDDELRGCRGTLEAVQSLAADVVHSAFLAAFRDPRFSPVGEDELGVIHVAVSVLSPLESIQVTGEADLLQRLTPGEDGLVIIADGRRATLLPQAWEILPEPHRFLEALKAKCGLAKDYWSDRLEFRRYSAKSYAEPV